MRLERGDTINEFVRQLLPTDRRWLGRRLRDSHTAERHKIVSEGDLLDAARRLDAAAKKA